MFLDCFLGCKKKEKEQEENNTNTTRNEVSIQKRNYIKYRKTQIQFKNDLYYKVTMDHPNKKQPTYYIYIYNFEDGYLGTFLYCTNYLSLSFRFTILDILYIHNINYCQIVVHLDSREDRLENAVWYIQL